VPHWVHPAPAARLQIQERKVILREEIKKDKKEESGEE
jgi:hypothetical protein